MRSLTFILLALLLPFIALRGEQTDARYALRFWTVEDRLPESPVLSVAEAEDGYLWLLTRTRLVRFNGLQFDTVEPPAAIIRGLGPFRGLFRGRAHGIWIYGENGLARHDRGGWSLWPAQKSTGSLRGIVESDRGVIYAVATRGLLEAVTNEDGGTRFQAHPCPVPPDDRATLGAVTDAAADPSGTLWLTAWNGLLAFRDGRYADQHLPDFLVEAVEHVHAGSGGRLWVTGPNGVAFREKELWTPIGFPENAGLASVLFESRDSTLWLGNPTGLYAWNPQGWRRISERNTRGSLAVNHLIEDRSDNLWAACDGGLLRLRRRHVAPAIRGGEGRNAFVYALSAGKPGTFWIGLAGHAAELAADGTLLRTVEIGNDVPVSAILRGRDDTIWFGTLGSGLHVLRDGVLRLVPQHDYTVAMIHTIHALAETADNRILAGTPQGLMIVQLPSGLMRLAAGDALLDHPVRILATGPGDTLWAAADGYGLARILPTFAPLCTEQALGGQIRAVVPDGADGFWIGTTAGLAYGTTNSIFRFTARHGLREEAVTQIARDGTDMLWLGSSRGIRGIRHEDARRIVAGADSHPAVRTLGPADGLPAERCTGGVVTGPTRSPLWFPTEQGLAAIDTHALMAAQTPPPPVAIETVLADGRQLADNLAVPCSRVEVPPGTRDLVFRFCGLAPAAPDTVRYRHKIDGLHTDWSDTQENREAVFTGLAPGRYLFRVTAAGPDGVWNPTGDSCLVIVQAHFWQTVWFSLLVLLGTIAAAALAVRLVLRARYRRQMDELKREEALHQERARISRDIHDDLGNGLAVVATLSDLAHGDVERGTIHTRLDQIYDVARELARNVDEIVWAVNPANDSWEAFLSYFEQYTEYFLGNTQLRFQITRPEDIGTLIVPSKLRHHLLLAVREAVGNVLKHARATSVRIDLRRVPDAMEVRVEDDGVGFDPTSPAGPEHDGLVNMRRRMQEIQGTFTVESSPGQGTRILFRVPLPG